jgi:hypothetical protein
MNLCKTEWLKEILLIVSNQDMYNTYEMALFYQLTPSETLGFKGEICIEGKQSKVKIVVLLCSGSTEIDKMKPLIIEKFKSTQCS